jgi:hypothetical protein
MVGAVRVGRGRAVITDSSPEPSAGGGERGNPVRGCGDFGAVTPGIALRHPGLVTGRPYGTGRVWRRASW